MELKSSRRKFLKTVAAGVIGGEILTGAAPAVLAKNDNDTGGFEIQKGFTVFNETTQKNMMKLAETIIPGCESIGMKQKLMQFLRASKGAAGFFDAGIAWTQAERPSFVRSGTREWITSVGAGARVNLFGFAIAEFNLAKPIQRPERGFMFVFNFRPGF